MSSWRLRRGGTSVLAEHPDAALVAVEAALAAAKDALGAAPAARAAPAAAGVVLPAAVNMLSAKGGAVLAFRDQPPVEDAPGVAAWLARVAPATDTTAAAADARVAAAEGFAAAVAALLLRGLAPLHAAGLGHGCLAFAVAAAAPGGAANEEFLVSVPRAASVATPAGGAATAPAAVTLRWLPPLPGVASADAGHGIDAAESAASADVAAVGRLLTFWLNGLAAATATAPPTAPDADPVALVPTLPWTAAARDFVAVAGRRLAPAAALAHPWVKRGAALADAAAAAPPSAAVPVATASLPPLPPSALLPLPLDAAGPAGNPLAAAVAALAAVVAATATRAPAPDAANATAQAAALAELQHAVLQAELRSPGFATGWVRGIATAADAAATLDAGTPTVPGHGAFAAGLLRDVRDDAADAATPTALAVADHIRAKWATVSRSADTEGLLAATPPYAATTAVAAWGGLAVGNGVE